MEAVHVCPRPLAQRDAAALIGLLAVLEAMSLQADLDPALVDRLSRRFAAVGLMANGGDDREFRQALNDMNHRIRYSLGEYDEPHGQVRVP
jgi:hypothetical protein